MDRNRNETNVHTDNTRGSVSVHRDLPIPRSFKSHGNPEDYRGYKRNRHNKYFLPVILCLTQLTSVLPAVAETVGGVSATAAPVANSSGSVTNQAIQVLQGPYITNTYGNGIQCQGPTMNVTPYVTGSASAQKPNEQYWDSPVYNMLDADDNGVPDNPGEILYFVPTRTGQKDNYKLSIGVSATWSNPMDKKLQKLCKDAAAANIALLHQAHANKRLDFEIARLKNCGNLMKEGISFHPKSPYYSVCADVVVQGVNTITPHVHKITPNEVSSDASLLEEVSLSFDGSHLP